MEKIYSTSVITDIRNFTGLFEKFQYEDSDDFLHFLEDYYKIQSDIAPIISDDFHMGSTGDGVLTIFRSENNHLEGYAFLLAVHKRLTKLCKDSEATLREDVSFGIAADSGSVWDVGKNMHSNLDTYVGTVINRTSRIEANTKLFGNTQGAIGYYLYLNLLRDLYPDTYNTMSNYTGKYDELLHNNPKVVLMSDKLALVYISALVLKNINKPLPIFRISEYLVKDDEMFWNVMSKLISEDKINKLKEIL